MDTTAFCPTPVAPFAGVTEVMVRASRLAMLQACRKGYSYQSQRHLQDLVRHREI